MVQTDVAPVKKAGFFDRLSPNVKAALLTIAATLVLAAVGAAYSIGYGLGSKDLAAVEDFKKTLPDLMTNLSKLAEELGTTAEMVDRDRRLTEEAAQKDQELNRARQALKVRTDELNAEKKRAGELQNRIDQLFPAAELPVAVQLGSAERVIPNVLTIGVTDIYQTAGFVSLRINGSSKNMSAGDRDTARLSDRNCVVELMKINNPSVDFIVTCSKK